MAISVTHTFSNGTVADATQVNTNFSDVASKALDKTGDTMTGDLKFVDATYDIGKSGATRPRDGFFSRNLTVGGTITGNVTGNVTGNLTGNVTGNLTGNADTVTNGVYTTGTQSIGGAKTFTSVLSCSGFGTHNFSAGGTGMNNLRVVNEDAGGTEGAYIAVGSDVSPALGYLQAHSSVYTTSAPFTASGVSLVAVGAGGLDVAATHGSGAIKFCAGGTTVRWSITSSGVLTGGAPGASLPTYGFMAGDSALASSGTATLTLWGGSGLSSGTVSYSHAATQLALTATYINMVGTLRLSGADVTYGANDSGGTGYKLLRVPN